MRERREITTRPDRAFFWNYRMHTAVKHLAEHLNDLEPDATKSERKHVCAQQHHRSNLWLRQWRTNSARMTANEIELELIQGIARNANVREFAKPRRNAINDGITRYDFFDNFARRQNGRLRESGNLDGLPIVRHGGDL